MIFLGMAVVVYTYRSNEYELGNRAAAASIVWNPIYPTVRQRIPKKFQTT